MIPSVQLRSRREFAKIAGYKPTSRDVSLLVNEDARVYKPNGELRSKMVDCGSPDAELERARKVRGAL